jgi:hypothetical protein
VVLAGFDRPSISAFRGLLGAAHWGLASQLASLDMWLNGDRSPIGLKRRAGRGLRALMTRPAALVALFLLTLPYSFLARKLNRASHIVVVARRR